MRDDLARGPRPQPPEQRGTVLATIRRGPLEELRVVLDEFEGKKYIGLRVWASRDGGRTFWPQKNKGLSIRLLEIAEVGKALRQAWTLTREERAAAEARRAEARARRDAEGDAGGNWIDRHHERRRGSR